MNPDQFGAETPTDQQWDTPQPIAENARIPLPSSAGRRPAALWNMVDEVSESYQVPRPLPFMLILAILATGVGGRRRVLVSPDWSEVLALYTAVAVPSGERKSPVLAALSAPLLEYEKQIADEASNDIAMQRNLRDLRQAAVEKIKRKGDTSTEAIADLEAVVREFEGTIVPARPRLLADDSTPEAMARIMADQGGRLGVLSAEGGLFATLAGRYSNGVANLDLVLKAWSGDFVRIDRASREPIDISEPVLSIGLAIQPDILAGLAEARHFRGSGLLARFLYSLPESLVGNRNPNPNPISEPALTNYRTALRALAETVRAGNPADMKITQPGWDALTEYRTALEPRLHPQRGDLAYIADWANKLPGQLVRVAALLTLFDNPAALVVDEQFMREAIELAPHFVSHARATFDLMTARKSPLEPARAVLRWIQRNQLSEFTVRHAWRDLRGQAWAVDADAVREAILDLEDLGWVRPKPQPERRGPGRPSEPYEVNPVAGHGQNTQNTGFRGADESFGHIGHASGGPELRHLRRSA